MAHFVRGERTQTDDGSLFATELRKPFSHIISAFGYSGCLVFHVAMALMCADICWNGNGGGWERSLLMKRSYLAHEKNSLSPPSPNIIDMFEEKILVHSAESEIIRSMSY
jgi:hypothetical protein